MYRQILIYPSDRNYQRIFWRPPGHESVHSYQLLTVTYGTASALYLALRILQQLTHDEGSDFPLAVPILQKHIYVDDCVFGADDIPLAHRSRDQLIALLQRAGFRLRKWASNEPALLQGLDTQDHDLAQSKALQSDESVHVLGINWHPNIDSFQFVALQDSIPETKRATILSTIARLFDLLGWLTPAIIIAKIIMQQLWLLKCNWDSPIPENLLNKWRIYYSQLSLLQQLSIPRWTEHGNDTLCVDIYGFADASTRTVQSLI